MNPLQNCKFINLIPPIAILESAESAATTEIDTKGWDYLTLIVNLGATDINMTALAVTEAEVSATSHANVTGLVYATANNIDGTTSVLPAATDDGDLFGFQIDLRGRMRYIDLTATAADGTLGVYVSGIGILSRGGDAPQTMAEMGCNQMVRI